MTNSTASRSSATSSSTTAAPGTVNPPPLFNSNPYQYLQHDDERYSAGFFSHYEVSAITSTSMPTSPS